MAGADKDAKDKVRETNRAIYTHTCGWQDGLKEEAPCDLFPIVVAEASTCAVWGLAWAALFFIFLTFVKQPFVGCQIQEENVFLLQFDTFFLLKESWESTVELKVRSSVLKNWKKSTKVMFSMLVHFSRSLPESCRMWILKLVSKLQSSCRLWSVVWILIWARELLHFPLLSFCLVCPRVHLVEHVP